MLSLKSKSRLENLKPWNFPTVSPQKFSVYQGGREQGKKASLLAEDLKIQWRRERQRRFSFPVLWGANNISMKNLAARWEIAVFTLISICSFPDNKKIEISSEIKCPGLLEHFCGAPCKAGSLSRGRCGPG